MQINAAMSPRGMGPLLREKKQARGARFSLSLSKKEEGFNCTHTSVPHRLPWSIHPSSLLIFISITFMEWQFINIFCRAGLGTTLMMTLFILRLLLLEELCKLGLFMIRDLDTTTRSLCCKLVIDQCRSRFLIPSLVLGLASQLVSVVVTIVQQLQLRRTFQHSFLPSILMGLLWILWLF